MINDCISCVTILGIEGDKKKRTFCHNLGGITVQTMNLNFAAVKRGSPAEPSGLVHQFAMDLFTLFLWTIVVALIAIAIFLYVSFNVEETSTHAGPMADGSVERKKL